MNLLSSDEGLASYPEYVGYLPTTFATRAKFFLSTVLVNQCVKVGKTVILAHEDDRPNEENINLSSYPYQEFGLTIRSLQQHYFNHFLSYKIERPPFQELETDTRWSLNAISDCASSLAGMKVVIEDQKFKYLLDNKRLIKADIAEITKEELEFLIRLKIEDNYIYALTYNEARNEMGFNVVIEIPRHGNERPARMKIALEYQPGENHLRVVTCF